jgi:ABC-type Mn2+/Zn2+ transport system ATPase subunit
MSAYLTIFHRKQKSTPPLTQPALLEFEHVTTGYNGVPALEGLTFSVPQGARVAVVGPNGAGKSTLFKALVGLLPLRQGDIRVHGQPRSSHLECVAYVPQREEVDWRFPLTVQDVVLMGRFGRLGWFKVPAARDREVARRTLRAMGIDHLWGEAIGDLSGGQQQRVFLARALAQEPHILLMDEPFTGVDISTQEAILDLLDLLKQQQVTVMISTHDLNLASTRFERVLLINKRLIEYGPPGTALTTATLARAFGSTVFRLPDGATLVDQCCQGDEEAHLHEHLPEGDHSL